MPDIGLTPDQNLLVGAGVNQETYGTPKTQLDEMDLAEKPRKRKGRMAKEKEDVQVRFWQERVRLALKDIEFNRERLGVDRFIKEYEGEYDVQLGRMRVPPINEIYSYEQSMISYLLNRNPYLAVNAKNTGSIKGARILEAAVNYYWRELDTKEEIEDETIDVTLAGSGFHKVGVTAESIGKNEILKSEMQTLYSKRVSFRNLVWNIGTRKVPQECRWMAERIIRPTEEVKDKYGARAAGLKGGPLPSLDPKDVRSASFKDDQNYSVLWEIWDMEGREVLLLAEEHLRFLKAPQAWPEYMDEYPYQHLYFNRVPDKAMPIPDVAPFEPQILEKTKLIAMALNHVKRWNRQLLAKRGSIRRSEMDKFEKGIDGAIINVDGGAPGDVLMPTQYPALQGDVYAILARLDDIKSEVAGMPASLSGGQSRASTRTLGQLEKQETGGMNRVNRKQDRMETHIENIARQLISHMKANFDMPVIVKITGEEPKAVLEAFGQNLDQETGSLIFSKEDIIGEYDVEVKAGSTLPLNKEGRMQVLTSVLEQAVKLAQAPNVPPFLQVVISEILRDLDIKSLEQAFEVQTQQAAEAQKQKAEVEGVETQKTAAEGDKRMAQAQQIRAETAIDTGKALHEAHTAGVLPQAIELGRGLGQFPMDEAP